MFRFRSITLIVSKMDTLMIDELVALVNKEITMQSFHEKLALNHHKFECLLRTKVQEMMPNILLPEIGIGSFLYF